MNKKEFLKSIRKEIHYIFDRDIIEKELNNHIEESINDLLEDGYSYEEAERLAIEQMGNAKEIGQLLNQQHNPLIGYLWMISKWCVRLIVVPSIIFVIFLMYSVFYCIVPITPSDAKNVYKVNEVITSPASYIIVDYVGCHNNGDCTLSIRYIENKMNVRIGLAPNDITVLNAGGERLAGFSRDRVNHMLGKTSEIRFFKPKDNIVIVQAYNGQTTTLDLGDYIYE